MITAEIIVITNLLDFIALHQHPPLPVGLYPQFIADLIEIKHIWYQFWRNIAQCFHKRNPVTIRRLALIDTRDLGHCLLFQHHPARVRICATAPAITSNTRAFWSRSKG